MDKKYGVLLVGGFAAVIVALALWSLLGNNVGTLANLQTTANGSFTIPAQNAIVEVEACGQANTSAVIVFNTSNDVAYPAANYTVAQGVSTTDGYYITTINFTGTYATYDMEGLAATIDCTYQPRGYVTEGGSRAVIALIPILFAIAIAIVVLPKRDWFGG